MENLEANEATFLTDKEIQEVINSISDDLIFDSVKEQITNVFNSTDSNPTFFITYFTTKYDFILNKYAEYEEIVEKVNDIRDNMFMGIKTALEEKFDFIIEIPESLDKMQFYGIITFLYEFLVIRNKDNSQNLVINYIEREMKDLIKYYKPLVDKKDLTYVNMKKFINKDITTLICKLPEIIQHLEIPTGADLISYMIEDETELTNSVIKDIFIDKQFVSFGENFCNNIISAIQKNETYYILIRTHFVNKYKEKK